MPTLSPLPARVTSAPIKPEVMSPVGGWPQLHAAVQAGAHAVFFGVTFGAELGTASFHARAKVGFSSDELPEIMRYLHERGVKGYVTFNVLVFDRELRGAEAQLLHLSACGVDAVIVQDLGLARLIGLGSAPGCTSTGHPDDPDRAARDRVRPPARRPAGHAGARAFGGGYPPIRGDGGGGGDVRPRCAVRRLLRPVLLDRGRGGRSATAANAPRPVGSLTI